jgi:hypothetical protein
MKGLVHSTRLQLALGTLVGLLAGCAQQPVSNGVPQWLFNPDVGVVASCGFHIGGRYQQEECAVQRGRERLAAEKGVEVNSIAVIKERVVNGSESVVMDKETVSKVKNKTIKARVKEFYYDAPRDEYYVWVVPN